MVEIEEVRSELSEITNARINFEPERPPRIQLPVAGINTGQRWDRSGATSVIHVDDPNRTFNRQNPELEAALDRIDAEVHSGQGPSTGIDALAWYSSFHNLRPEWGIYIPILSLVYIARRWLKRLGLPLERKLQVAFRLLHEHESFHFATDYMVAQWEIMLDVPCWGVLMEQKRATGKYIEEEEKLANAYMLRQLAAQLPAAQYRAIEAATLRQPPGYSEGSNCVAEGAFRVGLGELAKLYLGPQALRLSLNISTGVVALESFFPLWPALDASRCPVYVIDDASKLALPPIDVTIIDRIPHIEETEPFKKTLLSLPRDIQRRWQKKKEQLANGVPRHPEFEKLKGANSDTYSIRVGLKHRAHLKPDADYSRWSAVSIGAHTEMGHG
jgi:hypothetical protein